jgi:hypothetical protein
LIDAGVRRKDCHKPANELDIAVDVAFKDSAHATKTLRNFCACLLAIDSVVLMISEVTNRDSYQYRDTGGNNTGPKMLLDH